MAVARASEPVDIVFQLEGKNFQATLTRGQIVHEGFHKALPADVTVGHRLTFATPNGEEVFADNFIGDINDYYGTTTLITAAMPIAAKPGVWKNLGFDHLAIAIADRAGARDFFRDVLQMQIMRDDAHLTVWRLATPRSSCSMRTRTRRSQPANRPPGTTSASSSMTWKLRMPTYRLHKSSLTSDFTLLDRDERWSLYFFYKNGDITFMIQFSQVKEAWLGYPDAHGAEFAKYLYDYASRPYGIQFPE